MLELKPDKFKCCHTAESFSRLEPCLKLVCSCLEAGASSIWGGINQLTSLNSQNVLAHDGRHLFLLFSSLRLHACKASTYKYMLCYSAVSPFSRQDHVTVRRRGDAKLRDRTLIWYACICMHAFMCVCVCGCVCMHTACMNDWQVQMRLDPTMGICVCIYIYIHT
jgi:hypothetical protein